MTVLGTYTDGSIKPIPTGTRLTSSKPSVAAVAGLRVTAKAPGTTTVTAVAGSFTASVTVTVTPPARA